MFSSPSAPYRCSLSLDPTPSFSQTKIKVNKTKQTKSNKKQKCQTEQKKMKRFPPPVPPPSENTEFALFGPMMPGHLSPCPEMCLLYLVTLHCRKPSSLLQQLSTVIAL